MRPLAGSLKRVKKSKRRTLHSATPLSETIWDKRGLRVRDYKNGKWGKWEWLARFKP